MGYRSDIAIVVQKTPRSEWVSFIELLLSQGFIESIDELYQDDTRVRYSASGIKWYRESDVGIQRLELFLDDLTEAKYQLIAVGEEWDDVDYYGDFDLGLKLTRTITDSGVAVS